MLWLRFIPILIVIFYCHAWDTDDFHILDSSATKHRQKRNLPLLFPLGGIFKLILGFAVPIANPVKINLVYGYNFQYQYPVPPNVTVFSKYQQYVTVQRKKRSIDEEIQYEKDRLMLYKPMEDSLDRLGFNGRECLLRTICEAAETPIIDNGYVGELFHLMLSPRYDIFDNNFQNDWDADYGAARLAGEKMFNCRELYPKCPMGHGLFDMISILE